ncbi:protein indeterminate-domain 7-like [Gastrolobium bilobum]|uniref:protein indeterminate-domain 7-like n=1 Tax=Gastrolobium bilobum TaxID=150636 RepID=UPI002AB0ACC9|nr:protein indeterminate-domain 7-like [Gastrolobium bilobum]
MMKGLMFHQQQQQQQPVVEENMSNLTCASGEASVSSGNNRTEIGTSYPQQYNLAPPEPTQTQPVKRKRNLPGNPDPDAEVISMSPKSLMATNRFLCEICNKGFQRDQNLQLHRRGHNLPWKLKQRTSKEVRKKVYVCPETTCVHHDPSRALGDLTGIKKHFCRKHGEKKWKCDKCSKRYAVQSDWKAHSKTCGTREYRCDCGTLFSRRDSFITHRAFCDALAEESARAITSTTNPSSSHHINLQTQTQTQFNPQDLHTFSLKKEQHQHQHHQQQQNFNLRPEIPPWLGPPTSADLSSTSSIFSQRLDQEFSQTHHRENPNPSLGPTLPAATYQTTHSPHMSATALLQKAAQMGATMSSRTGSSPTMLRPHQQTHVSADSCLNLSSRDQQDQMTPCSTTTTATATGFGHCLTPYGNKAVAVSSSASGVHPSLLHDVLNSFSSSPSAFEGTTFDDTFGGILNSKNDENLHDHTLSKTTTATYLADDGGSGGGGGGNEGLTRDFLGLRPLSHSDILSIAGIGNCMNDQQNQSQKPWQG